MASCDCTRAEITLVVHIPILCVHQRSKVKKQQIRDARKKTTGICDDCRERMRAADDGWGTNLENSSSCTCN